MSNPQRPPIPSYGPSLQPSQAKRRYFAADPGVEFRGEVPLLPPEAEGQPQEFRDGKVRVFDLSDAQHLADYNEVVNQVARGAAILCKEDVTFSEKTHNFMVFVRWMVRFYAAPDYPTKKESEGDPSNPPTSAGQFSL